MSTRTRAGLGAILGLLIAGASAAFAQAPGARPVITLTRAETPPRLEDYVTGEAHAGTRIDGFLQRNPGDLTPATEATQAFLSYDAENIYAVFVCRVSDRSKLRAHMARRESIFNDDHVVLFLDTFNDRQRAYMFFSTPLGIQADGITSEGQQDDFSFDLVWHSRGLITQFGYVVWMAIPFKSLRFAPSDGAQSWGLAVGRSMPVNNEQAFWPGITNRISGFTSQFAEVRGFEGVSAGRNIQAIPYGTFTGARFLDRGAAGFGSEAEGRMGVDAKVVLKDAVTLDFTANPDFSQVESDEPQVTVNQRFEVFFPEKRPFFLENSGFFQTPVNLFFSRRLRDPQFGARMTGKLGGWAVGGLTMDDRAPGHAVPAGDPLFGDRAFTALVRARREVGQSSVGALVTSQDFGPSASRVASLDTRLRINPRWFFDGQAIVSDSTPVGGEALRDGSYYAGLSRSGRGLTYQLYYQDVGRDFRAPLGFVPRTDIRQATSFATYRWRPRSGAVQAFGPNSFAQATWDHEGILQDWLVRFPVQIDFKRQTGLFARRAESFERFAGLEFRESENLVNFYTSALSWMDISVFAATGTRPNFYPAHGAPSLASFLDGTVSFTFRPTSQLLIDETYLYSHLGERAGGRTIFDNHIVRTKVNYQFDRALSLRAILDYNAVLSDTDLVALDRTKHLTVDLLMTYLVAPGTAIYAGYTDGYDNITLDPLTGMRPIRNPTTSTGRQVFLKTSYLFRF